MLIKGIKSQELPIENLEETRSAFREVSNIFPSLEYNGTIEDRVCTNSRRETPVRLYTPEGSGPFPAVMYMHGGGFCLGDLDASDNICRLISQKAGCTVISVDYALAPEYKYPYALEECLEISSWIRQNASSLNLQPEKIAYIGDSAGGNLAAVLSLLSKESKNPIPCFQGLICPVLDLYTDPDEKTRGMSEILLTTEMCRLFNQYYLEYPSQGKEPYASPVNAADLSGLPPAVIITAELDPLAAEGRKYAELLQEAGVEVTHYHYPGMVHDFPMFTGFIKEAKQAVTLLTEQLSKALHTQ